mgnify:CR=1 FL=1
MEASIAMNRYYLLLFIPLIIACRSYKVSNLEAGIEPKNYLKAAFILDTNLYPSRVLVGDFKVFDGLPWSSIKSQAEAMALENQANAIWVESFRNRGISMRGKLYQIEPAELVEKKHFPTEAKLHIFRDELGSPLGKAFKCNLKVSGKEISLKDQAITSIRLKPDAQFIRIEVGGIEKEISLNAGVNYLWVYRDIRSNVAGGSTSVAMGGFILEKLEDPIRGALWVKSLQRAKE